jgi:hypothetical protein
MSVVGHDDLHCYRSIQEDWRRGERLGGSTAEFQPETGEITNGTSDISMRNQFRLGRFMTP